MKKLLILGAVLVSVPFVSFAQTSTTTGTQATGTVATTVVADPGLLPGDFFYFLDRWTEALNLALTFNKENKARKHLEFAKERIAEMGKVLEKPNAKLDDVQSAKDNFDAQIADAATLVKSEKDRGADVADLARELDDELDASRDALKDILKGHGNESSRAEEEIRAKLATLSPTDPQVQGLTQALESITKEKMDAMKEEGDLDSDLIDEQALFEEVMGKELSAQKHLERAMRLRDSMEQELPEGLATSSEKLMRDAEAAMNRGDFESAKHMSEQAKEVLEKAREISSSENNDVSIDETHIDDLEEGIKGTERAMEGLGR